MGVVEGDDRMVLWVDVDCSVQTQGAQDPVDEGIGTGVDEGSGNKLHVKPITFMNKII